MKKMILLMGFVISTTGFANEGGSVKIRGEAANQMIFTLLESLKNEGNPGVSTREEGDALILQLASKQGTLTCKQSEGMKNGEPAESVVTCDVNVD